MIHIVSENFLKRPGYIYDENGVGCEECDPHINWRHIDGPLLYTSDGTLHWLTYWERIHLTHRSAATNQVNSLRG